MICSRLTRKKWGVRRGAFTLVEVLVVLVLISILSGMVMTAIQGVTNSARIARTRSIIAIIDSVLQEQYESYKYRPLPVTVPDLSTLAGPNQDQLFGYEVMPSEAARVRVNMIRDLQRMELPDRKSDIVHDGAMNFPARISAVVSPVVRDETANPPRIRRDNRMESRQTAWVEWYGTGSNINDVPSRFSSYYRRALPNWTEQHQGSECLYLILSSTFIGGAPAIEMIPASNIGDTDGDGMLEILDGWGRPIEFIRWPSGFHLADSELALDLSLPDDFDLFRSDFGYLASQTPQSTKPWSLRPLVVSAGSDGELGMHLIPRNGAGVAVGFRYNAMSPPGLTLMTWPISPATMGAEHQGRTGSYVFIDPYLRRSEVNVRPGNPIAGLQSVRADNITNYQLGASE